MDDPELQAIRQRRLQELMGQRGVGGDSQSHEKQQAQEEQKREAEEQRQIMLTRILSPDARARLSRIALVKPEKARGVEDLLLRSAQFGQITEKVSEERLIALLEQINEQTQKATKITVYMLRRISQLACSNSLFSWQYQIQRRRSVLDDDD